MKKHTAYIGSYNFQGNAKGISIYDIDEEKGRFVYRDEICVNNCAYLTLSKDNRCLYAVVDEGVAAFRLTEDGSLDYLNTVSIRGLRGCHADVHPDGGFIAVAGYYDGKMTVLSLKEDGALGEITAEYYNKGVGSVAERNFRPHISCTEFTPHGKYICMVDSGIDQIKRFRFDRATGGIQLYNQVFCPIGSGPHHLSFSQDGRFAYLVSELSNTMTVYAYKPDEKKNSYMLEHVQTIPTLPEDTSIASAACTFTLSPDGTHLICSNAGQNSVAIYSVNKAAGELTHKRTLPISGEYPIDLVILPDGEHLASINNESDSVTFFTVDYQKGTILMNGLPLHVEKPNCCVIAEVGS